MSDELVAGIDFSGAKQVPNDTWIAKGRIGSLGLDITEIKKIGSHTVAQELSAPEESFTAVGMDVPFSLPSEFLSFLTEKLGKDEYQSWQQIAEELVFMSFDKFLELVEEYKKEPKRVTDKESPCAAQSPLHRGNPSMVQMTYQGIRLLATVNPEKFAVLPFQDVRPGSCRLIEVYPRATLFALGLPDTGYKGKEKKEQEKALSVRKSIVENLIEIRERKGASHRSCPRLNLSATLKHTATETDHALDALIACYTTAMWLLAPELFADPMSLDSIEVLLEGWIYSPKPLA